MPEAKIRGPAWPFWGALGIALPIVYALGIGPACWLVQKRIVPFEAVKVAYMPLARLIDQSPESVQRVARRYCEGPLPPGYSVHRSMDSALLRMELAIDRAKLSALP